MPKPKPTLKNRSLFRQITPPELKKGELRKLEIVEATIDCLAKYGWIRTNYETVGQACNMKRPHVAYHYPQWDDLISASMKFVYATGQSIVADYLRDTSGPKEQLRAYLEGTFHWFEAHPKHASAITLLWHLASFDRKFRAISTEMKQLGAERVDAILNPGKPLDKKGERWRIAVAIHGMIVGRCVEVFSTDFGFGTKAIVEQTFQAAWHLHGKK
jgi:AcrR family transcriptional regulator